MLTLILSLVLILIAAVAKAVMDRSSEGNLKLEPTDYWLKGKSWVRKWKNGDPSQGPAFAGSTTVFVFLTDGWHLAQFFFLSSLFGAWALYDWKSAIVGRVLFGLAFEGIYSRVLK